jgi:predicted nucleic acid-binding protein
VTYLVDTNVLSEVRKPSPEPSVAAWFAATADTDLFLSVLVVGEIRQGIERLRGRDPRQAGVFESWLEVLKRDFSRRVLPVSTAVAEAWGRLSAPKPLPAVDSLLAATALVHGLILVTRDTSALDCTGVPLLNPWEAAV